MYFEELKQSLALRDIGMTWTDSAVQSLVSASVGGRSGARGLQNAVRRQVEDAIASALVRHGDVPPAAVQVDTDEAGKVCVRCEERPA